MKAFSGISAPTEIAEIARVPQVRRELLHVARRLVDAVDEAREARALCGGVPEPRKIASGTRNTG